MQNTTPTVFIVDDDPAVLDSLAMLITAQGMKTVTFPNAMEFLDGYQATRSAAWCWTSACRRSPASRCRNN